MVDSMNKRSKATVALAALVLCLVLLVTVHVFTDDQKQNDTASDKVTLTQISSLNDLVQGPGESETEEAELSLFSLDHTVAGVLVGSQPDSLKDESEKVFLGLGMKNGLQFYQASFTPKILPETAKSLISLITAAGPGQDSIPETKALKEPAPFLYDKAIAKVNEYVNIRAEASANSEIVGKLYKNSYGTILERGEEWTKLTSGAVTGYIKNEYLYFDAEALSYARKADVLMVEITAGSVNIRKEPNTECGILTEAKKGTVFTAYPELSTDEFYAISYEDETAYVTTQYSELKLSMKKAVSKEEESQAKRQAEIKKALTEAKKVEVGTTNRKPVTVSDEEIYLLATVVSSEALYESYEGKLAVANVIVNRLVSGKWGDSISDVVYAPGQFSGSKTGRFEKYEKLMDAECKKAAVEALAGVNNIGDFMFFRTKGSAKLSSYSKYYILGNHCFYQR